MKNRAVFLDRDGTIVEERDYLARREELRFIPGSKEAIKRLRDAGFKIVVVTNQSGIARGYFTEQTIHDIHETIQQRLRPLGTRIDGFYYCPHHPSKGLARYRMKCNCRKPGPGMFLQAVRELGLDLNKSFLVGDSVEDIRAAQNLRIKPILVLTGYGRESRHYVPREVITVRRLADAAELILKVEKPSAEASAISVRTGRVTADLKTASTPRITKRKANAQKTLSRVKGRRKRSPRNRG